MVTGDHQHAHSGLPCLGDRCMRLGTRGIDDADHPEVHELTLERLIERLELQFSRQPPLEDEAPQRQEFQLFESVRFTILFEIEILFAILFSIVFPSIAITVPLSRATTSRSI